MMQSRVFLCLDQQCKAFSRYIEEPMLYLSKDGEHYGHDCEELSQVKDKMSKIESQLGKKPTEAILQKISDMSNDLENFNSRMVAKLTKDLKLFVSQEAKNSNIHLVKAVIQNDLIYLQNNQQNYLYLKYPNLILEAQEKNILDLNEKVTIFQKLISKHCSKIFSLHSLLKDEQIRQRNSLKLVNLQSKFDQKVAEFSKLQNHVRQEIQQGHNAFTKQKDQLYSKIDQLQGQLEKERQKEANYQAQIQTFQNQYNQLVHKYTSMKDQLEENRLSQSNQESQFNSQIDQLQDSLRKESMKEINYQKQIQTFKNLNNRSDSRLTNYSTDLQNSIFWSGINKHSSITIDGQVAENKSFGHNVVLLEPKLNPHRSQSVKLKIIKMAHDIFLHVCDLKTIKLKCHNFINIYKKGFGAYSHLSNGRLFTNDIYAQEETKSFEFGAGDILELHWNGPLNQFTTLKVNTGEIFNFDVKFEKNAEIYFAISFGDSGAVEIL